MPSVTTGVRFFANAQLINFPTVNTYMKISFFDYKKSFNILTKHKRIILKKKYIKVHIKEFF